MKWIAISFSSTSSYTSANWGNHSLSPSVALTHTKEALISMLSHRKPQIDTVTDRITHLESQPFTVKHPVFFSLLGDLPQPWSHEATGWGVSGVCVGDELLKPPSCGQLPGHRMDGLWAACLMKRASRKTGKKPRGEQGKEREGALALWLRVCVCVSCQSPLVGTPNSTAHPGTRESEAKAGQKSVLRSILVVIIWGNVRQPPHRRCWTDRHAGEEGAQTDRYPAEAVLGQTGGAGDKQTAAV